MKLFRIDLSHCLVSVCLLLSMACLPLSAQTVQEADAAFKEFVRLNNMGGDRTSMFNTLFTCYTDYVAVINRSSKGSDAFNQAKTALKTIYPYLSNGAGFFSQNGNQQNATLFARAGVDLPLMEAFSGETFQHNNYYPTIVYFAACNTYNSGDYDNAIKYLNEYVRTGDTAKRKTVLNYLYQAYMKVNNPTMANGILEDAVSSYPNDFNVLSMAINACIDAKDYVNLSKYVNKALMVRPNDPTLMNIQGKMYEDTRDFENALKVYTSMRRLNQKSMSVTEHVALNTYNLGVMYFNKASLESNSGDAKKLRKTANEYFSNAANIFSEILLSDPTSLKYTQALAIAYSCLGDTKQLDATNFKLAALGGGKISSSVAPSLIGFDDKSVAASSGTSAGSYSQPATTYTSQSAVAANTPVVSSVQPATASASGAEEAIPHYTEFAKAFLEKEIKAWQSKDQFETMDEYKKRVTNETLKQKVAELQKVAEQNYISRYTHNVTFADMKLMPYDADNQSFLIKSRYGDMVLPVPREKSEAKIFESNWNGLQFKDPKYYITGDSLALASLTFVTPAGNTYRYDNQSALTYTETKVNVNFAPIDYGLIASTSVSNGSSKVNIKRQNVSVGASDVDTNIPKTKADNDKTFAIIISNENYQSVPSVAMANNDGATFAKYCRMTLGIPENNIRSYPDATFGGMIHAMQDIRNIASAYNHDINVIFYYAGHGIPNEATKDAYLLPVDADGTQTEVCYSLNKLYGELSALNAKSVIVFLDACFSGATSDGGNILASARGGALKAKKEDPRGNMVVFSAASDDETAFPYKEKGHGLFTYYLLKKLQETKGNVTLKDLGSYITDKVKQQSVVVNHKVQTPTVSPSAAIVDHWQDMKLRP